MDITNLFAVQYIRLIILHYQNSSHCTFHNDVIKFAKLIHASYWGTAKLSSEFLHVYLFIRNSIQFMGSSILGTEAHHPIHPVPASPTTECTACQLHHHFTTFHATLPLRCAAAAAAAAPKVAKLGEKAVRAPASATNRESCCCCFLHTQFTQFTDCRRTVE